MPESFQGHTFTEKERAILLSNGKKADRTIFVEDLWSEKKQKHYSAELSWNRNKSKIEMSFPKKK